MRKQRGQALVELALCAPVLLLLGLGAAATVQVLEAQSGLQAATDAAVSAGARAPDAATAAAAAAASFDSIVVSYPLRGASLSIAVGAFARGSPLTADSNAVVDVDGAAIELYAQSTVNVERWRSRP